MSKLFLIALLASLAVGSLACKTKAGSREYIPGKGWVPN